MSGTFGGGKCHGCRENILTSETLIAASVRDVTAADGNVSRCRKKRHQCSQTSARKCHCQRNHCCCWKCQWGLKLIVIFIIIYYLCQCQMPQVLVINLCLLSCSLYFVEFVVRGLSMLLLDADANPLPKPGFCWRSLPVKMGLFLSAIAKLLGVCSCGIVWLLATVISAT